MVIRIIHKSSMDRFTDRFTRRYSDSVGINVPFYVVSVLNILMVNQCMVKHGKLTKTVK